MAHIFNINKEDEMSNTNTRIGTVKFFNEDKGFGFITPESGGKDDFVHVSALNDAGIKGLSEGDRVEYSIGENRGKPCAENVRKI